MTLKQEIYHKQLIKKVHISQRYKHYFKEEQQEYEKLLLQHFGTDSSKNLTIDQLLILIDYLNGKRSSLPEYHKKATQKQIEHIQTLWKDKSKSKTTQALLTYANRFFHKGKTLLTSLTQITTTTATKLIRALKRW